AMIDSIVKECSSNNLELPTLRLESGRGIAQGTAVTLGRVGVVKEWPGHKKWANLDVSTNHIMRIITSHWYHHIIAANKESLKNLETYDVVGPLCIPDELGLDRKLPLLERGDLLAILDTGAYAEPTASNFNAQPRPATVLVS
ncbi:unnamed protein product, partial [marine sediment metagenome]